MFNTEKMDLTFIVNGTETIVSTEKDDILKNAVLTALEQSENTGRSLSEWQVICDDRTLSSESIVNDYENKVIFLSLRAGMGG